VPAILLLLICAAAPAWAGDREDVRAKLRAYDKLKKREATLQIVVRRASAAAGEKYRLEYEALKPKLYEAADAMEKAVQAYERNHGKQALCAALTGDVIRHVPACLKKK
jgi:hypothetical protein